MEASEKVLSKFPLDSVLFILTSGFIIVISFPFTLPNFSLAAFHPFVNVGYLNDDFVVQLSKLFISSLVVGMFVYLLYGLYERANHIPKWLNCKRKHVNYEPKTHLPKEAQGDRPKFYVWISKHMLPQVQLLNCMSEVSAGFLFGAETLWLLTIIFCWFSGQYWWQWLLASSVFVGVSYIAYYINGKRAKYLFSAYYALFKEYEKVGVQ